MGRSFPQLAMRSCALCMLLVCIPFARALTTAETLNGLNIFIQRMRGRSPTWQGALSTWTCPTRGGGCDPCGDSWWGNWDHMHCRGINSEGKDGGTVDGHVTNIHLSDLKINGPIPRELCLFPHLRGFPHIAEMDLSYNRLTGSIPRFISNLKKLQEFEVRYNRLSGWIPWAMGEMPLLRELELDGNALTGPIPDSFKLRNNTLTGIFLANNDFEGDLSALAGVQLMRVNVHNNAKLCGMVPGSVRWAHGYNPYGTGLGKPCRTEIEENTSAEAASETKAESQDETSTSDEAMASG